MPLFCLPDFANFSPLARFAREGLHGHSNARAASKNEEQRSADGENRQGRIESIIKAAVARKEPPGVLHAGNAL